jgi:hypothetical protein
LLFLRQFVKNAFVLVEDVVIGSFLDFCCLLPSGVVSVAFCFGSVLSFSGSLLVVSFAFFYSNQHPIGFFVNTSTRQIPDSQRFETTVQAFLIIVLFGWLMRILIPEGRLERDQKWGTIKNPLQVTMLPAFFVFLGSLENFLLTYASKF